MGGRGMPVGTAPSPVGLSGVSPRPQLAGTGVGSVAGVRCSQDRALPAQPPDLEVCGVDGGVEAVRLDEVHPRDHQDDQRQLREGRESSGEQLGP